jgi:hypothetical protein
MIGVTVLASAFGFVWIALWAGFLGFVVRERVPKNMGGSERPPSPPASTPAA